MPGKNRFLSEQQATSISTFKQDSFAGGLNTDRPASELSEGELAKAENVQCFPKDIMGRPGTTLFKNRRMPGTGTFHQLVFHQSSKKWLLHQGSQLWKADETMSDVWEELLLIGVDTSFAIDLDSSITENRENFIISTTSGIFHVLISDDTTASLIFQANSTPPSIHFQGHADQDYAATTPPHSYRIIYTYVRLSGTTTNGRYTPGAVLEQETGSANIADIDSQDYALYELDEPLTDGKILDIWLTGPMIAFTGNDTIFLGGNFSFQTGDTFIIETTGTPPSPLAVDTTYYAIRFDEDHIQVALTFSDAFAGTAVDLLTTGSGALFLKVDIFNNYGSHHTHLGVYITNDLGSQSIDPSTNTGFDPEVYTWVKDVEIQEVTGSLSRFGIEINPEVQISRTEAGGFNLKTRQWAALPSGDLGEVAGGWFFSATSGETTVNYSQINDSSKKGASIGYYNTALQVNRLKDGVRAFIDIGDYVIVCTSNKTYMYRINSFNNVGSLESVFQLTTPARIDDKIGVIDVGTISQISEGRFIAVCSDASVRIFDTVRWGSDLSLDKIKSSEIKKMQNGSVSAYWQGAYYLWYRKDSTDTHNTNTLRLAVEDAAGEGWTTYGGDSWIKPPLDSGAINFIDSNDISRIVVVDFTSLRPYWIETFDGYSGSGLVRTFIDKSDDPGICALGSTYVYDALDDSSFDTGILVKDLIGAATITEGQTLNFVDSVHGSADEARVITVDSIASGDDFDISTNITDYNLSAVGTSIDFSWNEVKLAPFASGGDDIEIGALAGDGVYFYVKVHQLFTQVYRYSLHWKAVQGATTYTSTQLIGSLSEEIRVALVGTTLTWYYGGVQIDTDTDAAWGAFPIFKGSFAGSNDGSGSSTISAKHNYFSFIAESGLSSSCIGLDGFGSSTVTGRSPSGTIKTKEIIGVREANNKEVQEAHAYLRPSEEADGFPSAFEVDAKDYVDGSITANETVNDVRYLGDIQFFKEASGRRLQAEFITNSTDFRMTSLDVDFIEKREKAHPLTTEVADSDSYADTEVKTDQEAWHDYFWEPDNFIDDGEVFSNRTYLFRACRYDYTLDLSEGVRANSFKTIKSEVLSNIGSDPDGFYTVIGPDGKVGSAIALGDIEGVSNLTFSSTKFDTSALEFHVWNFWVKKPPIASKFLQLTANGNQQPYIQFNDTTTLNFAGLGTVTVDAVDDGEWHNFWVYSTDVGTFVYQNSVLKGSFSISFPTFGGVDIVITLDENETEVFDVFLRNFSNTGPTDLDTDAFTDYYNDVVNNEGRNYLP